MRLKRSLYQTLNSPPDSVELAKKKATSLAAAGKVEEAVELLSLQLQNFPSRTDILLAIAKIFLQVSNFLEAIDVLIVIKAHLPSNPEIAKMLGMVFADTRQYSRAVSELERAQGLIPNDPEILITLAKCYESLGQEESSIDSIQKAIQLDPANVSLRCSAAAALHHAGRGEEASEFLLGDPELGKRPEVRLLESMLFPVIPVSVEQILERRQHYRDVLTELSSSGQTIKHPEKTVIQTNFLLGYHGLPDRELIELSAKTMSTLCPELVYTDPNLGSRGRAGRKLEIGFVSSNMRNHSVGRVLNGFLKEFDRERFSVTLFELPGKFEGGQELGRKNADRSVFVPADLKAARTVIAELQPDILVFPDFVLDPTTDRLAFSRLAPVQCSTWGHPGTSGRPSIDYWVSCEDWEPAGNERFYSEKLVRFKQPPMIASRLDDPNPVAPRSELGIPEGRLYGCPQTIYKLHPEFDEILAEVLRRDPEGHVVLIGGVQPHWLTQFRKRFGARFPDQLSRIVTLPHLDTRQYLSLLLHCEVSLDPTHFGGANTSMEAFTMGLPVVTWPGDQVRNRQTYSFYRMMEYMNLVVGSQDEYVELVLKLAHDRDFRNEASKSVKERCPVIFETVSVTREWEAFFEEAAAAAIPL